MLCSKGRVGSSPTTGTMLHHSQVPHEDLSPTKGNAGTYPKGARVMSNPPIGFDLPPQLQRIESGWRFRLYPNRQNETLFRNILRLTSIVNHLRMLAWPLT
jgi:hypothetical protein